MKGGHKSKTNIWQNKKIKKYKCGKLGDYKWKRWAQWMVESTSKHAQWPLGVCESIRELKTMKEKNNRSPREGDKYHAHTCWWWATVNRVCPFIATSRVGVYALSRQGSGDFWAQPSKIRPFTTSTGFSRIWPGCKLVAINLDRSPIFFSSAG